MHFVSLLLNYIWRAAVKGKTTGKWPKIIWLLGSHTVSEATRLVHKTKYTLCLLLLGGFLLFWQAMCCLQFLAPVTCDYLYLSCDTKLDHLDLSVLKSCQDNPKHSVSWELHYCADHFDMSNYAGTGWVKDSQVWWCRSLSLWHAFQITDSWLRQWLTKPRDVSKGKKTFLNKAPTYNISKKWCVYIFSQYKSKVITCWRSIWNNIKQKVNAQNP